MLFRSLQTLFARRDQYIKFLYHREMEFSQTITNILQSRSYRWGSRFAKLVKLALPGRK